MSAVDVLFKLDKVKHENASTSDTRFMDQLWKFCNDRIGWFQRAGVNSHVEVDSLRYEIIEVFWRRNDARVDEVVSMW